MRDVDAIAEVDGATASKERRDVGVANEWVDRDALLALVDGCRASSGASIG